jgi:hypothetical protein
MKRIKEPTIFSNFYYSVGDDERAYIKSEWLRCTGLTEAAFQKRLYAPQVLDSYIFHACTNYRYANACREAKFFPIVKTIVPFEATIKYQHLDEQYH